MFFIKTADDSSSSLELTAKATFACTIDCTFASWLVYEQLIKNIAYASGFMNHSLGSNVLHVCMYMITFSYHISLCNYFTALCSLPPLTPLLFTLPREGLHASSQVYFHSSRRGIPPLSRARTSDWLCYIKMVKLRFEGRRAFHWRSYYK